MSKAIMCIVDTKARAEAIVEQLQSAAIANGDISVLFPDKQGTKDFAHEKHTKAPEGGVVGASAGGVVGGTLGLLAGIGALAIPGIGPFIAAGPIMAALSGAAVGAGVGGVTGALIGLGIPELEAKKYEDKIRSGNLLVAVHTEDAEARKLVKQIFESNGAKDISTVTESSVPKAERVGAKS